MLARIATEAGPFDVVIDDGGHLWGQQLVSLIHLWPAVAPGGLYVVEDLHTSYHETYRAGETRTTDWLKGLVDAVNLRGRSFYGDRVRDPNFAALAPQLDEWERTVFGVHFFKSIAFVEKQTVELGAGLSLATGNAVADFA